MGFVIPGLRLSCGALRPHPSTSAFRTDFVQAAGETLPRIPCLASKCCHRLWVRLRWTSEMNAASERVGGI